MHDASTHYLDTLTMIHQRKFATALMALALASSANFAHAVSFTASKTPSVQSIYLQVGTGTIDANNATINKMVANVSGINAGNGVPQTFSGTGLPITGSPPGGAVSCVIPTGVYVTAQQSRKTNNGVNRLTNTNATLTVSSPATLTGVPVGSINISQISWLTDGSAGIAPGTFSGGTQTLAVIGPFQGIENCLTFNYANSALVASGKYSAQVTYTLSTL